VQPERQRLSEPGPLRKECTVLGIINENIDEVNIT